MEVGFGVEGLIISSEKGMDQFYFDKDSKFWFGCFFKFRIMCTSSLFKIRVEGL